MEVKGVVTAAREFVTPRADVRETIDTTEDTGMFGVFSVFGG
jgi:hypothetical protein